MTAGDAVSVLAGSAGEICFPRTPTDLSAAEASIVFRNPRTGRFIFSCQWVLTLLLVSATGRKRFSWECRIVCLDSAQIRHPLTLRDSIEGADAPYSVPSVVLAIGGEFAATVGMGFLVCGLTFELSGRRRQDARPGLEKMYRVPPDRAWWPAVGAPLERGVRQRCAR